MLIWGKGILYSFGNIFPEDERPTRVKSPSVIASPVSHGNVQPLERQCRADKLTADHQVVDLEKKYSMNLFKKKIWPQKILKHVHSIKLLI